MKKFSSGLLLLTVLFTHFFILMPSSEAKTLGDVKKELEDYKTQYEENKKKQALTTEEIATTQANIKKTNIQIEQIGIDVANLKLEIENLTKEIAIKDEEIKKIVNFLQISNGESAYLEYAFGAKDFTDFIYRVAVAEQLAKYNDNLITEYNNKINENNQKTEELAAKKIELNQKQKSLATLLNSLQDTVKSLEEESLSIDEEIALREELIDIYEVQLGCTDDEDISYCGSNKIITSNKLVRPTVAGRITAPYGYSKQYIEGVWHGAVDLGWYYTYGGDNIYAAGNGVVATVYNRPCGNWIVYIHHKLANGDTYTTGYWHMRSVNVRTGEVVTAGTVIGSMGGASFEDTCSLGPHLHFEVAEGLYLIDYQNIKAYRINPISVVNFPQIGVYFYDRITAY